MKMYEISEKTDTKRYYFDKNRIFIKINKKFRFSLEFSYIIISYKLFYTKIIMRRDDIWQTPK